MTAQESSPIQRYRMRPAAVDAMQFDGTSAGVERLISWARIVAPGWPIRPRTEYVGWDDPTGHLELEVKEMDHGCTAGDWILVTTAQGRTSVWIIDDASFRKYYEKIED